MPMKKVGRLYKVKLQETEKLALAVLRFTERAIISSINQGGIESPIFLTPPGLFSAMSSAAIKPISFLMLYMLVLAQVTCNPLAVSIESQ